MKEGHRNWKELEKIVEAQNRSSKHYFPQKMVGHNKAMQGRDMETCQV